MNIKPFKLERYYTLNEFSAQYSLCNSDCEAMTIKALLAVEEGAEEAFGNLWLGYTETAGHPLLRQLVAESYREVNENDLLICSGAQEPIYLFSQANLKSSDEVIVQTPCYQSLQSIPESLGCKVRSWQVRYEDEKPVFDIDHLKSLISPKTKVIYLNTPHNPTGFHFSQEEQMELVELARARGIILFCDEVYREMEHNPKYAIPAIADIYENGVSIGVMSKSYGLPGLRIGWVASQNKEVINNIAILKEYTTICNAAPSEFLASIALRNREQILKRNLKIIQNNIPLFEAFFEKYNNLFSWFKPNAGPIAFVKMKFEEDDMIFADRVLKKQKVLLLPGGIYDYPGHFRVGFGRTMIPEALRQFEAYVENHLV